MASGIIVFLGAGLLAFAALSEGPAPQAAAGALLAAIMVTLCARRLGVGASLFIRFPRALLHVVARTPGRIRGALDILGAALDLRPRTPAFVRLRLRPSSTAGLRSVTETFSGAPGMVSVEAEPQNLLAHVMNEASVEVVALQRLETVALKAAGERL